jgi:hypothetical protein
VQTGRPSLDVGGHDLFLGKGFSRLLFFSALWRSLKGIDLRKKGVFCEKIFCFLVR